MTHAKDGAILEDLAKLEKWVPGNFMRSCTKLPVSIQAGNGGLDSKTWCRRRTRQGQVHFWTDTEVATTHVQDVVFSHLDPSEIPTGYFWNLSRSP